jgi:hypothetical protein
VRAYERHLNAGQVLTSRIAGTTPAVLGFGALTAIVLGAYDYTGGSLTGYTKDPEIDEFERKEALRKNRRRPIEETINELGEGRGRLSFLSNINAQSNRLFRNIRSGIRRKTSGTNQGEVRHRGANKVINVFFLLSRLAFPDVDITTLCTRIEKPFKHCEIQVVWAV